MGKKNERCRRANVVEHTRIVDSDTIADDGEETKKIKEMCGGYQTHSHQHQVR